MSDSSGTLDDLKTLEHEAAELQERRQQADQIAADKAEQQEPGGKVDPQASISGETDRSEDGAPDLAHQLEIYINEIEEAALERPTLALLTIFALGIIVGHLFSRK